MSSDGYTEVNRPETRRNSNRRFKRIRALECFGEVKRFLVQGISPRRVARYIQEEQDEYTDVEIRSLEKMLRNFKKEELSEAEKVANQVPSKFEDELEEMDKQINVLEELGSLYQMQLRRIQLNIEKEQETEQLMSGTGQEIRTAKEILESIGKFQQEFGMEPKHLGTLSLQAEAAADTEDVSDMPGQFMMNPVKRNQVLEFLDSLDKTDPRAIDAVTEGDIDEGEEEDDVIDVEPEGGGDEP